MQEDRDTTQDESAKNADNPEPSDDVGKDPFDGLTEESSGAPPEPNDAG